MNEEQAGQKQKLPSSMDFRELPAESCAPDQPWGFPAPKIWIRVKTSWSQVGKRSHAVLEHTDDSFHTEAFLSTVCLTPDATMSTLNNYVPNELCLKRRGASDGYKKVSV